MLLSYFSSNLNIFLCVEYNYLYDFHKNNGSEVIELFPKKRFTIRKDFEELNFTKKNK